MSGMTERNLKPAFENIRTLEKMVDKEPRLYPDLVAAYLIVDAVEMAQESAMKAEQLGYGTKTWAVYGEFMLGFGDKEKAREAFERVKLLDREYGESLLDLIERHHSRHHEHKTSDFYPI